MSLYSLRSQVSELESELRRLEAINRELRNELSTISNGVSRANDTLENFNSHIRNTLENSDNMMHHSHRRVIDAYELQGEIERLYILYKNMELANKKIRAANNKKYYDFANYRTVRKIVQGIMDNLDVNMISDQTITKAIEVQHLQIPDYWLTCVLISVMAWKNDDKALADRAMARAVNLDKKHCAVFYMLFNLRHRREQAAMKWFFSYQECEQKGSDRRTFLMLFSLVSRVITETVDESTRNEVSSYINSMIISCAQAEGYDEAGIVSMIRSYYTRLRTTEQLEYALLRKHCGAWGELADNLTLVKNNINILEYILRILNVPEGQRNEFLKDYIDELIAEPNQVEESVYDEIAYNELVIRLGGDVDTAKEQFAEQQQKAKSQIDLISEMVGWIFERDNQEISGQMRLNMFTLTKDLQEKSIISYAEDYRSRRKRVYPVTINDYSSNVDFKQEGEELRKIESFYTTAKNNALAAIKDWKAYLGFGIAALSVVGAFFAGFWLFVITAACIGYGVFVLLNNKAQRNALELKCIDNIRTATDILRKLFVEFIKYQTEFSEHDSYHERIMNELSMI